MKYSTNCLDRERLEVIFNQAEQKQTKYSTIISFLNRIGQQLLAILTRDMNELQIWQSSDDSGNTWWNAYDPVTDHRTSVDSEAEMRAWIERRYYR